MNERRIVAAVTSAIYVVTTLPYLAGYLFQDGNRRFTGIVFDVEDTAQYYAWMRAFSDQVLIANPLTPEAGSERFFNLQWWLLGKLAFGTSLGPTASYQILRVLALAGFAATLYWFCTTVLPRRALFAWVLVMISSGFGWTLVVLKQFTGELHYPLSVQIAEPNAFFAAMAFPHLLIAAAMLLTIFTLFLKAESAPARVGRYSLLAAGVTLALGFSHGYDLIPAVIIPGATVALHTLWRRRITMLAMPLVLIGLAGVPPGLYALGLTRLDSTWSGVIAQYGNAGVFTPSPPLLVVLLGLPFLLALPQLHPKHWWRQDDLPATFLRVWFVVGFGLLYIPTDYQVKMLIGYQIPAVLLAVQTLDSVAHRLQARLPGLRVARVAMPGLVIAFLMLTNVYLTAWRIVDLRRQEYPYYLTSSDVAVLESLPDVTDREDIVLSSVELGLFVPVYSDARPYVAHWAQTLRFFERREDAQHFFSPDTSDDERIRLLREGGIDFVLSGPAEAAAGGGTEPVDLDLERLIAGPTSLYRTSGLAGQR